MELNGKHVLITGAARRVARHLAERLLAHSQAAGLRLTAHYHRSHSEIETLLALGKEKGRTVFPVAADLRKLDDIRKLAQAAEKRLGHVDILINSASDFFPTPVLEATESQWDHLLDLNLKGQFFLTQALGPGLLKQRGLVINIADVNGERPMRNHLPYVCSKAGLLMMTKALAKEWAPQVRVNAVSPGAVLLPENYNEAQRQRAIDRTLLKRLGSPEDVVQAVFFLIQNDYITGFNLCVDGGRGIA